MQKNHEKISLQYDATQKKLKQRLDKILDEKKAWESEKRMLLTKNGFDQELVNLNVGGTHKVTVSQKVLQLVKNSQLAKMFSGMHELKKVDDAYFIDRDGATFLQLINFLRNDRKIYPEFETANDQKQFSEELIFWGIRDDRPEEKKLESQFSKELMDMLRTEPGGTQDLGDHKNSVNPLVKQTWNMLGPLRLLEITRNSTE